MNLGISNTLSAFDDKTVGTKVINASLFFKYLEATLDGKLFPSKGPLVVDLPDLAFLSVSGGSGLRAGLKATAFHTVEHRGRTTEFLKRTWAEPVTKLSVGVYGYEAYMADDDVQEDPEEMERAGDFDAMVVFIHASAGVSERTLYRYVAALKAGTADVKDAGAVLDYADTWCDVADEGVE